MTERTSACSQCRTPRRRRAEDGSACPSLVAEAVGEAAFIGCAQERRAAGESGQREPWVARTMIGLPRIVNVVPAFALRREALAMAFNDLREIARREADQNALALDRTKAYENLYGHLWQAYKDRFQALMRALGFDIGFLFQKDDAFEKGASAFVEQHPQLADLVEMMRRDRADFQKRVGEYRNDYIEHRKDVDPKLVEGSTALMWRR